MSTRLSTSQILAKKVWPGSWKNPTLRKKFKDFVVYDPFVASFSACFLQAFDHKEDADIWLEAQQKADRDGFAGCVVISKADALVYLHPENEK